MEITAQQKLSKLDAALDRSRVGDDAWALHEFEELERLSGHPQDIAALRFFQTRCLTDLGRAAEALQRISSVDKSWLAFTNQVDYEFEFARIERALGRKSEALARSDMGLKMVEEARGAQDIKIVFRNLQTIRGILLAETERYDEAIPMLEAVPTEDEGWAEARIRLGDCNVFKRQFHEAVEA